MIREPDIPAVIAHLDTITDVTDITSDRIFHWGPVTIPDGIYITLSMRKTYQNDITSKPVLRFRAFGHDDTVTLSDLYALKSAVVNALVKTDQPLSLSTWYGFSLTATSFDERVDANRPMLEFWLNWFLVNNVQ